MIEDALYHSKKSVNPSPHPSPPTKLAHPTPPQRSLGRPAVIHQQRTSHSKSRESKDQRESHKIDLRIERYEAPPAKSSLLLIRIHVRYAMSSLGNAEGPTLESGAVSVEANPPSASKKSTGGRKPPKKSDAAATAAAELERQIQNSQGNPKEIEDDDDAEEEEGEDKAPSGKGKNMLVDHTYTNYAIMTDKELQLLDEHSSLLPEPKNEEEKAVREKLGGMSCTYGPMKKSAGGVVQPFPGKVS